MAELDTRRPFTAAQARAAGMTRWRLEGREHQRLLTGVYVASGVVPTPRVMAAAALRIAPPGTVLSHHTAAVLWGGVVPHASAVHVSVPDGRRVLVDGVVAHRPSDVIAPVRQDGLPVTSAVRTYLDLSAHLDLVDLVVLGDSLVQAGACSPESLVDAADRRRGRGARLARQGAALVRRGAESPMESRLRLLVVLAGLPEPVLQHVVPLPDGSYRLDLAWPAVRVALEYDGRLHVERESRWAADLGRRERLEGEGWRLVVAISSDVFASPDVTLRRIEGALRRAGLPTRVRSTRWRRHFPVRVAT